jgi:hypothetical protein
MLSCASGPSVARVKGNHVVLGLGCDPLESLEFDARPVERAPYGCIAGPALAGWTWSETQHAYTFELQPDEEARRRLQDRIRAGGTLLTVAVPEDEEVAATYFRAGVEPKANRPRPVIESGIEK